MKRFTGLASVLLVCVATPALAQAADGASLAAKFGALEGVAQASLSPDGRNVAFISRAGAGSVVYVADVVAGGSPRRVMSIGAEEGRITHCNWTAVTRIVCSAYYLVELSGGNWNSANRQFAVDIDGKNLKMITAPRGSNARGFYLFGGDVIDQSIKEKPGSVLMLRDFLPDDTTGSRIGSSKKGLGVELVDTLSGKRTIVEQPRDNAFTYRTDGLGTVRIMGAVGKDGGGYNRTERTYYYRKSGERSWEQLSTYNSLAQDGFYPVTVDPAKNVVYGFDDDGPYRSLFTIALDGSLAKTKVLGREGYDIDEVIAIGRQQRVVGASYATEHRVAEYFDPELKALTSALHKALPGSPQIDIAGASEDEKKLLVIASGDTAPGQYYVYDKGTRQLAEVLPVRPQLAGVKLAEMKPITYKAADGTAIPGYLTVPAGSTGKSLPAIVMPHGGPSARDEWGFDWLVQYFAARGFAVLQPNFRGSAGYGSDFFQKNGFQSWRTAIGDVNDAGRWLVSEGIAAPNKLAIFGWSYGGYAALQSGVLDPSLYKAIVAVAPLVDLEKLRTDSLDYTNGVTISKMIGQGPHVREGSPAQNAAAIMAPVLMFSGDRDLNVDVTHPRLMKNKLEGAGKQVTYVEFTGLDHYLVDGASRTRMLSESDAFIRKALGMPAN